jgi:hypothetical protein
MEIPNEADKKLQRVGGNVGEERDSRYIHFRLINGASPSLYSTFAQGVIPPERKREMGKVVGKKSDEHSCLSCPFLSFSPSSLYTHRQ